MILTEAGLRNLGIEKIGGVPWGTSLALFYRTRAELLEILTHFFQAGLQDHEACLYITSRPLENTSPEDALISSIPGYENLVATGQLRIVQASAENNNFVSGQLPLGCRVPEPLDPAAFSGLRC